MEVANLSAAMDAIAPQQSVEAQVLMHFAPNFFLYGSAIEIDGQTHRVTIRPGNVKLIETDANEYKTDAVIVVDGEEIGFIDPERKTDWCGGEWPERWTVNLAAHPRSQIDNNFFYPNSRTNKLKSMRACATKGKPGFILLYSNAFGDSGNSCTAAQPNSKRSALLVPASALYSPEGVELLPIEYQVNRFGQDLPVFKPSLKKCFLVNSPQVFEGFIFLQVCDFIRSLKDED